MSKSKQIILRDISTIVEIEKPVFFDESGYRWRFSKYIIGALLSVCILFSFFAIESTISSSKSLIALSDQSVKPLIKNKFPILVDLDSNYYSQFKQYIEYSSEIIFSGNLTNSLDTLEFMDRNNIDVSRKYIMKPIPGKEIDKAFLEAIKKWNIDTILIEINDYEKYNDRNDLQAFFNQLNQVGVGFSFLLNGNNLVPNWANQSTSYRLITLNDLKHNQQTDDKKSVYLFEYSQILKNDDFISENDYIGLLKDNTIINYDSGIGKFDDVELLDSVVIHNFLEKNKDLKQIGFSGIDRIDSRFFDSGSMDSLSSEFWVTQRVDTRGDGQMYSLVNEGNQAKVEYKMNNNFISETKVVKQPKIASVQRFGFEDKKINLSFDDGPNPEWTPKILDILKERNIKATFFVNGVHVRNHPDIAKRIIDEGHEIGNHTYLHSKSWKSNPDNFRNEILQTQYAVKDITGYEPRYFRTPYNESNGYVTNDDLVNLRIIEELGLQPSEFDVDTEDWTTPGIDEIIRNLENDLNSGVYSQILMHDGGVNKQQTIESLPKIIDIVESRGVEFVTLDSLQYEHKTSINKQSDWWRFKSLVNLINQKYIGKIIKNYTRFFTIIMFLKLAFTLLLFGLALLKKRRYTNDQPGVSILIPAYNEELTILATVESVLQSDYPLFEIIVINDGSKDNTLKILTKKYKNNPLVKILDKQNGGKAAASNSGIKLSKYDYLIGIDADSYLKKDAITKLMRNFYSDEIAGVAGNIHIGNFGSLLTQTQRAEYIFGQSFDKEIAGFMNSIAVIPGAIGAWRKQSIIDVGGYNTSTITEDTDLTLSILKTGKTIVYEREAIVITEVPGTLSQFFKQRKRWMFGTLQCIWKHKNMIGNPKYGYLGLVILPEIAFTFLTLLMLFVYLYLFGVFMLEFFVNLFSNNLDISKAFDADIKITLFYVLGALLIYFLTNVLAVIFDNNKNKWQILWYLPFQMIVYRNFLWVIQWIALFSALKGGRQGWNHLKRTGLAINK
jgi:cellulose synthase/poly-beta-1,6-N-acetylglucosamine synthase-like glycosyltransferase/peptidoglycan/xylan/chitin deacetylase (PgdA/CDA1 family)